MVTIGVFKAHIAKVRSVLRSVRLFERQVDNPKFDDVQASSMSRLTYREQYETCLGGNHFHFLLKDRSFIQFRRWVEDGEVLKLSYSYYECPRITSTYEDFLYDNFQVRVEDVADDYHEEFEAFLATQPPKETVTPIRYDYNVHDYNEGLHPASHIHIGHKSEVRMAVRKILRPMSFLLLILRQCYPRAWVHCLAQPGISGLCRDVRSTLEDLPTIYWKTKDEHQLFLA
jgi:hypothetical protein